MGLYEQAEVTERCHVLASESFEDPETAKIMNGNYVNIMIDREERPDVDRIYMGFLQVGFGWSRACPRLMLGNARRWRVAAFSL